MRLTPVQRRDESILEILQLGMLCALLIVSATTFRRVLWVATPQPDLFAEFQGVVLFMSDFALMALMALTVARLITDSAFRHMFTRGTVLSLGPSAAIWWAALPAWMMLSATWAQQPLLSIYDALGVFAVGVAALLIVYFVQIGAARPLLVSLVASAVIQSAIGVAQLLHGGPLGLLALGEIRWIPPVGVIIGWSPDGLYRANGLTVNPNNLAGYLMIALFGLTALIIISRRQSPIRSGLLSLALLIISIGLIATLSRGAILPVALSFALWAGLQAKDRWLRVARSHITLLVGGIFVLLVGGLLLARNINDRLLNLTDEIQQRVVLLAQAGEVIQQHPLLGTGAGNLMLQVEQNRLREDPYAALTAAVPAHNVYFVILAELGPVGAALFVGGCIVLLFRLRRRSNPLLLIWVCCLLAVCGTMLVDYYFWYDHRSRALFFFVIGMVWAYSLPETSAPELVSTPPGSR